MNKSDVLERLRVAKELHINWVQKAKMLISGLEIPKDAIPVNTTECQFGKWFYLDAQKLNALQNNPTECMKSIEKLHLDLHGIYMKIFIIYYKVDERGLFAKLFGIKREPSAANKALSHTYFQELEEVSDKLINEINRMEKRILAVSNEEIEKLY